MDEISSPSQQLQQLPISTTTKTIKEKQLSSPRRQGTGRAAVLTPAAPLSSPAATTFMSPPPRGWRRESAGENSPEKKFVGRCGMAAGERKRERE
ncbi:unnamed protein product [Linum trigynum]|uniref:Uncharacterized protein n=1 Tax=Linum trigynum TaxID=586398 RepID=A0AAV2F308_9ROSI